MLMLKYHKQNNFQEELIKPKTEFKRTARQTWFSRNFTRNSLGYEWSFQRLHEYGITALKEFVLQSIESEHILLLIQFT